MSDEPSGREEEQGALPRDAGLTSLPVVAFDEAGNTGQNLLDSSQPVFVLASVHMERGRAAVLAAAAAPTGAAEAKFSTLRGSAAGRRRVLALLRDGGLTQKEVRLCVYHKSFMVTTKIVDALVETWHHAMGFDLYENAAHLGLANVLHMATPALCGAEAFAEWQARFVAMVRDKTDATVEAFYAQTEVLRERNTSEEFDDFLGMLGLTRAVVDEGVRAGDRTALDPAIPALVQLAAEWSAALGTPFDLVHDQSKPVATASERLSLLMAVDEMPKHFDHLGVAYAFPLQAPGIRFADSRDVPQLQIADLVAGAAATVWRSLARGEPDPFADDLLRTTALPTLVTNAVWPDTAVSPEELDAARRPGSAELDFIVDLSRRRAVRRAPPLEGGRPPGEEAP